MKNMLISWRQILHSDLSNVVSSLFQAVQGHEQGITHIKTKMEELFMEQ